MIITVAAAQDLVDALTIAVDHRIEVAHEADLTLIHDRYRSRHVAALILDFRGIDDPDPRMIDRTIRERISDSVIAIVDRRQVGLAIEAVQRGVHDCLLAPVSAVRLRESLRDALMRSITKGSEDIAYERAPVGVEAAREALRSIVGSSSMVRDLRTACVRAARSSAPVLLVGEPGSGKERVARAIHELSVGAIAPYVVANVCAIPETLFDSMLFGARGGAYTGAVRCDGLFASADGGTLFLDEIGDLSYSLQSKLLRAVEYGSFLPLGAHREERVSTRLVTATNRDLERAVVEGTFREDLLHRLSVLAIRVPSLREHLEDIPEVLDQLIKEMGRQEIRFAPGALRLLREHRWNGNYRELKAVVERTIVSTERTTITVSDLRFDPYL